MTRPLVREISSTALAKGLDRPLRSAASSAARPGCSIETGRRAEARVEARSGGEGKDVGRTALAVGSVLLLSGIDELTTVNDENLSIWSSVRKGDDHHNLASSEISMEYFLRQV